MPIPYVLPPEERSQASQRSLQLVPAFKAQAAPATVVPRFLAYCLDLMVVGGLSLYVSKWLSLILVSFHMKEIRETGRVAGRLFRETVAHGHFQAGIACFVFFSFFYFVMMPHLIGRTLGLGLLGLKIQDKNGSRPSVKALLVRQMGCVAQLATGGMMLLQMLKGPARPLFQDSISGTTVVKNR